MIPIPFTGSVHTVKILVLESAGPNLDAIVRFLRCFPCVEKLYIQSCHMNVRQNGQLIDSIDCLDLHLREIVMNGYQGKRCEVNFAKFFVLHARVLKVMKFGVSGNCDEKWMANQREQLHLDNRAHSVNAVDQLDALSRDTLVIFVASSIRNILVLGSLEVRVK